MSFLSKLFGGSNALPAKFKSVVGQVNSLEDKIKALSDADLKAQTEKFRFMLAEGKTLDDILPEAFATVREAARRTLGQRHYDVQIVGGAVLHSGAIAEMRTGEGKTLVGTLPVYLNALSREGVHVVTVNEYLAKRDMVWMGQVYQVLGLSVACLVHQGAVLYDPEYHSSAVARGEPHSEEHTGEGSLLDKERDTTGSFRVQEEYLRPISRRQAYEADITYGTNHEFGFDYLRDNLAPTLMHQSQAKGHAFAVIDEVDSILIDEARTPLIIAAPDQASSEYYKTFSKVVSRLIKGEDYLVDEKKRGVEITEAGINKVEELAKIKNLYAPENLRLAHYLQESLKAHGLFARDRDYVVKGNEVIIVDQFTGRLMQGRRYNGGLHQAIEAKEGVFVQEESRTYAQISIQNYFRLYKKLSGMTGTAQTSAEEFHKVYNLEVVTIPTNQPMIRKDEADLIYKTIDAKYNAIIEDIKKRNAAGQPILIGTVSIEKNEELSRRLSLSGLKHEMLNAKNNQGEGAIIAQAGRPGAITVATNMAGRGVDIILGGNPSNPEDAKKVKEAGGLHVVGTERHESRRIDNQLRGRAGRQGDPGSSQFFLSMEDDLMRIFGGDRLKGLMERLKVPDDMPIQAGMLNRSISQAQSKVEGHNFDVRKHLLEYDDVLNKQRLAIYRRRQAMILSNTSPQILGVLDKLWMEHLESMDGLREGVGLRAVGQHDPLVEYRREGHILFQQMTVQFDEWLSQNEAKIKEAYEKQQQEAGLKFAASIPALGEPVLPETPVAVGDQANSSQPKANSSGKIGRNDPCPCGSGKKYKKCGLINAPEHKK